MTHTQKYRPELIERLQRVLAPLTPEQRNQAEQAFLQLLKKGDYATFNGHQVAPKKEPKEHEPEQDK